jgi:hypothetical protein
MFSLVMGLAPAAWAAQGEGLVPNTEQLPWDRWETRLSLGAAPLWRPAFGQSESTGLKVRTLSLMGDYYFARSLGSQGGASGFRTTSGVILGARSGSWSVSAPGPSAASFSADRRLFGASASSAGVDAGDTATLPYLGIGYSGLSARGGWSVTADVGLVALAPGQAVKLGRVFNGSQALDDMVRDMRLSPVMQLGVSYSF